MRRRNRQPLSALRLIHEKDTRRKELVRCELPGCIKATTGLKPFCTSHVKHMPYVKRLIWRMATRG